MDTRVKTATRFDLSAAILFKLTHSCLNAFTLIQLYIVNSKESARKIAASKTSLIQDNLFDRFFYIHFRSLCKFLSDEMNDQV